MYVLTYRPPSGRWGQKAFDLKNGCGGVHVWCDPGSLWFAKGWKSFRSCVPFVHRRAVKIMKNSHVEGKTDPWVHSSLLVAVHIHARVVPVAASIELAVPRVQL